MLSLMVMGYKDFQMRLRVRGGDDARYLISLALSSLGILSSETEMVEDDGQMFGQLVTKDIGRLYW